MSAPVARRSQVAAMVRDAALEAEVELVAAFDLCCDAGLPEQAFEGELFAACRALVRLRQRAAAVAAL